MDRKTPLVSVIIPTYNRAHTISQAIDSVLNQTYGNLEIIVIDDGSTDNTKEILAPYGQKITYLSQSNCGVSSARNAGIQQARGEYVAFLDSDDLWYPQKLEKQIEAIQRNKEYALCLTDIEYVDDAGSHIRFSSLCKAIPYNGYLFTYLLQGSGTCSYVTTILVKKGVFTTVGLFDESLNTAEDIDMLLRITSRYQAALVDEPLVKYIKYRREGDSNLSDRLFTGNRIRAIQKIKEYCPQLAQKHQKLISRRTARINLEYAKDLLWQRHIGESQKQALESVSAFFTFAAFTLLIKIQLIKFASIFISSYKDKGSLGTS